jgi:hypothetical protein
MPHARLNGTAWDKKLEDYAYTRDLDMPGWAWEFLRRNQRFQADFQRLQTAIPLSVPHSSGVMIMRSDRRYKRAERWGLLTFADPRKTALETDIFWKPEELSEHVGVTLSTAETPGRKAMALEDLGGQASVFSQGNLEHVIVRHGQECARLTAHGLSILHGKRAFTFEIEGFEKVNSSVQAIQTLQRISRKSEPKPIEDSARDAKWRDYLVGLDGHLANRTYRDIAEVLHGPDHVKSVWTNETRHLKDRIRRAVERGIELMKGGYRRLL